MQGSEAAHRRRMLETPIPRLIIRLSVPTVIGMMVSAVYNLADTYFVSALGKSATGAVSVIFSLMAMIQAIGFTIGMGSGSQISRFLGAKREKEANEVAATGFASALALAVLLTIGGLCTLSPLIDALGATETMRPYALDYARIILLGAPVMCGSFVMNNLLRAEGHAAFSMIGIATGALVNIALDPLFIFVFDWKIAGAATATVVSQAISFLLLLSFFLRKKSVLRLHPRHISRSPRIYWNILKTGFPSLCRQGLASAASVALNRAGAVYGDSAVAAMSIVGRVFMMIQSVMIGVGQGFQPVIGFNYGAGRWARVRKSFWFTVVLGFGVLTTAGIFGYAFAPQLMRAFLRKEVDAIAIGTEAFRYQCLLLPILPISIVANMTFQSIGKSLIATILSCARQGIFFLPLIWYLPRIWDLRGVELAQPLADACTVLFSIPFLLYFFHALRKKEVESDE